MLVVLPFSVIAQHIPTSFDAPPRLNLSQIDNREHSTLLFFDYYVPNDTTWNHKNQWINFGDKTYLSIPGSNKKYKMLSTVNMPIDSEAEHRMMLFDRPGQRHQFVLEFEKLPDNCSNFELIENVDNPKAFNIKNISYNPQDSVALVNIDDFIADYPVKEYGHYYLNGTAVYYVKYNGIIVNSVVKFLDHYGKYYCVNISIQNFSDRSVLFNPNNLYAVGYRHPKKKKKGKIRLAKSSGFEDDPLYSDYSETIDDKNQYDTDIIIPMDLELLSYEEYDRIVHKKQKWESFWAALGEGLAAANAGYSSSKSYYSGNSYSTANAHAYGNIGGIYGYANVFGSSYTTSYGQSHTVSYNGYAQYAANQQARANIASLHFSQNQIRQQIGEGYVKMHTISKETEYSGFFNIKFDKKMQGLIFTITIDGEPYTFYF